MLMKLNREDLIDLLPADFLGRKELWDVITSLVSIKSIYLFMHLYIKHTLNNLLSKLTPDVLYSKLGSD